MRHSLGDQRDDWTMTSQAIVTKDLCVSRRGVEVLRAVSCSVPRGTVTGLLGPSGSGKTTLLRSLLGVQRIASGSVEVLGRTTGDPALRSTVGYASQAASVYDDLTVRENLRYFAAALAVDTDAVARVIDAVDLGGYTDRLTGRLSGGQRSRVSLAVAMLGRPELLVLDEPTVGLDPVLREDLWRLFHDLAASGTTLLVSSHVMAEAERCNELLLLRDGAVLAHESPAALKQRTGADTMDDAFLQLVRAA
jgi:ABC-2 type transport system ATP-binding protein